MLDYEKFIYELLSISDNLSFKTKGFVIPWLYWPVDLLM